MNFEKNYKFLVFGNPMVAEDRLPMRMIADLRKKFPDAVFKEFDPNENLEREGRDLNIIDTVEGIDEVKLITDIDSIVTSRLYSMHDYDLGHCLKLLKKMGWIDSVRIFGVPMKIKRKEAFEQLTALISASSF